MPQIEWPEIVQILAYAALVSRGFLAIWSLVMAGLALLAAVAGARGLVLRACASGIPAWIFGVGGCLLQPDGLPPNYGFLVDRLTVVVMLAVALPLWVLVYVLNMRRGRRDRRWGV
jgi:hypothetical protein